MLIPQTFILFGLTINSLLPFALVGLIVACYVFWYYGKREGFDEEKLFDLIFITLVFLAIPLAIKPLVEFIPVFVIANIVFIVFITKIWHWSGFRILDLHSSSEFFGFAVYLVGIILTTGRYIYIPVLLAFVLLTAFLFKMRNIKIKSGYAFSLLLLAFVVLCLFFERSVKDLIFYAILTMISLVNIFVREKISMEKTSFPTNMLNNLKNKLLSKRKRLKVEQKKLQDVDPYNVPGREKDNAELMDDALLEDAPKELSDILSGSILKMQVQVRKALGRMRLGKYGTCEVCGKPIDKARLNVYPEATTCLEHAPKENA